MSSAALSLGWPPGSAVYAPMDCAALPGVVSLHTHGCDWLLLAQQQPSFVTLETCSWKLQLRKPSSVGVLTFLPWYGGAGLHLQLLLQPLVVPHGLMHPEKTGPWLRGLGIPVTGTLRDWWAGGRRDLAKAR